LRNGGLKQRGAPTACFTNHERDFDSARYRRLVALYINRRSYVRTDERTRDLPVARTEINWRVMVESPGIVCSWRWPRSRIGGKRICSRQQVTKLMGHIIQRAPCKQSPKRSLN